MAKVHKTKYEKETVALRETAETYKSPPTPSLSRDSAHLCRQTPQDLEKNYQKEAGRTLSRAYIGLGILS